MVTPREPLAMLDDFCRGRDLAIVRPAFVSGTGHLMDFEEIRPYVDAEVPAVLQRLSRDPVLAHHAARFVAPSLSRWAGPLVEAWVAVRIRRMLSGVRTVAEFQRLLARAFAWMIRETTAGFSYSGIESIDPAMRYLFVSNHRDIAMDSGFLNYALHLGGHPTTRIAFGDNLLATGFAADIMRLNKGFVVKRSAKAGKAAFAAMLETSRYVRDSLECGESVWIAQREGRAKDGWDRTDPAIVKMLTLAYRREVDELSDVVSRSGMLPVAISYEFDPCDIAKARELAARARGETWEKREGDDLRAVLDGVVGAKGRVHLHFGTPLTGHYDDAETVAAAIDRQIVTGFRLFPSHYWAAAKSGIAGVPACGEAAAMAARYAACPAELREAFLLQYANPVRRARELDLL
jgi:1-acyl-sn-glycerol-3-phosphate acyltransferase